MIRKILGHRVYCDKLCQEEVTLADEEPLQIVIQNVPYTMVMRLPGDEIALTAGFCLTDGIIESLDDLAGITFCKDNPNKVIVTISENAYKSLIARPSRSAFLSQSSCGICGKEIISDICTNFSKITDRISINIQQLFAYAKILKQQQKLFSQTGCVHAAALFGENNTLVSFAEDIGRHNALDKAIGKAFLEQKLTQVKVAVLSSRASFEMVQKAGRARIPVVACVSAPTYLGVQLAERLGVCLVGFLREPNATIYTLPEQILI